MNRFERRGWPGQRLYQLHVELVRIEPAIWRRLLIHDAMPLPVVHQVLQGAFGWEDRHLHCFQVGAVRFGPLDDEPDIPTLDEAEAALHHLLYHEGDELLYEYDFGDSWEHRVRLEDVTAAPEPIPLPTCLDGARAAPPEDCGGPHGYSELTRGKSGFDPEAFDRDLVNRQLAVLAVRRPRGRPGPRHGGRPRSIG